MTSQLRRGAAREWTPADIRLRDPFVLTDRESRRYWLYGTTDPDPWHAPGVGFDAWWSDDLERWRGPVPVFRPPREFWADRNFWAPEVYRVEARWVMAATFCSSGGDRGVQTLLAGRPDGPFRPLSRGPVTPSSWQCLDGTLTWDDAGRVWMVFCREWLEVDDGRMYAMPMSRTLDEAAGEPVELFRASDAPWVRPVQERHHFVTDGPWLHRLPSGRLVMLWSSFSRRGYAVGLARSDSGGLHGPWRHLRRPLVSGGGGHAMLFRDLDHRLVMALHAPNHSPCERMELRVVEETASGLRLPGRWRHWLRGVRVPGAGR